jgi:hypothetical protein
MPLPHALSADLLLIHGGTIVHTGAARVPAGAPVAGGSVSYSYAHA